MTYVSDFAARHKEYADKMDVALAGLEGDVKYLNDKVNELQNSPGQINAEDQKILDEIEVRTRSVSDKFAALDDLPPPKS